jgi:nitroimidazol reductase NimA-like FMN-containing flavoprotein (pyridoxamine 5'-phosphate oxidase superfamily)
MTEDHQQERARLLIERNSLLTLATVNGHGRPWISPVFYSIDDEHQVHWVSDVEARHSANIRETAAVALVIHDMAEGATDAVYIEGTAAELNDHACVREGMEIMARRDSMQPAHWRINGIGEVTGEGPWRVYKATRNSTSVRAMQVKGGKHVVARRPANF